MADDVLVVMLPEKADVFTTQGDRTGPRSNKRFMAEVKAKVIVISILTGLKMFDHNVVRKQGAIVLLAICPNPIEVSNTPFADRFV